MENKQEIIIWKYHNGDYVSHYLRFQNEKGNQEIKLLSDEELKMLGIKEISPKTEKKL